MRFTSVVQGPSLARLCRIRFLAPELQRAEREANLIGPATQVKFLGRPEGTTACNLETPESRDIPSDTRRVDGLRSGVIPELSYRLASGWTVNVMVLGHACRELIGHCAESNRHGCEVGGLVVGYRFERCPETPGSGEHGVCVTNLIPIAAFDRSGSHICFDEGAWARAEYELFATYAAEGKCRLGWYHTHPTQGIFFSAQDRNSHTIFRQAHQFALVIDPQGMEAGLFYWRDYNRRAIAGPIRFFLPRG